MRTNWLYLEDLLSRSGNSRPFNSSPVPPILFAETFRRWNSAVLTFGMLVMRVASKFT